MRIGAFQTPLGHRGPSLSSPGQRRALGAHHAPRRPHDQLAARPSPADSSPGASARRRALGPRRVVRATGRDGAVRWSVGGWPEVVGQIGRPPPLGRSLRRRKGVHSDRVNRRWRRAEVPPPLPGAGSCRRQRLRGRRHLPLRQPPDLFVGRSVRASSTPYPLGSYGRGGFRGAHSLPARVLRPCTALSPTLLHFFPATNLGIRHRRPHPRSRDEDGTPRLPSPEPHPFNRQAGRACHLLDRLHPRPRSGVLLGICFGSHVQYGISKSLWVSARVHVRLGLYPQRRRGRPQSTQRGTECKVKASSVYFAFQRLRVASV